MSNRLIPKVIAVAFSALLASFYVCHSARTAVKQPRELPVTQHVTYSPPPQATTTPQVTDRRVLMPGSKSSAMDFSHKTPQYHSSNEASSGPVYPDVVDVDLGGFDSAEHNAEPAPAPKKPLHPVFLPGSKSDRVGVGNSSDE